MRWLISSQPRDARGRFTRANSPGQFRLAARRYWAVVLAALAVLAASIGFVSDMWSLKSNICGLSDFQPTCISAGLVPRGTPAADHAWRLAQATGSCDAYRSYLRLAPDGVHADEAAKRVIAPKHLIDRVWKDEERHLPLYKTYDDRVEPEKSALGEEAARLCAPYSSGEFQLRGEPTLETKSHCETIAGHRACTAEGFVHCHIKYRYDGSRESCASR